MHVIYNFILKSTDDTQFPYQARQLTGFQVGIRAK